MHTMGPSRDGAAPGGQAGEPLEQISGVERYQHTASEGTRQPAGASLGSTVLPGDGVYRPHRFAEMFPLLEGPALAELIEDVRQHGVREPIVLLDGMVLDGRNRYFAAREAGQHIPTREYDGDDPLAYVISCNLRRRHLSESQRAMVAAKVADMPQGARTDLAQISAKSQPRAAELLNVSRSSLQSAAKVIEHGTPALVAEVDAGTVSVSAAAEVATLPEIEQFELVARGEKEIIARAKELRAAKIEANRAIRDATQKDAPKRRQAKLTPKKLKKQLAREKRREADEKRLEADRLRREKVYDQFVVWLRARSSAEDKLWLAEAAPNLPRYATVKDLAKRVCAP
jgi:hypothetical protein